MDPDSEVPVHQGPTEPEVDMEHAVDRIVAHCESDDGSPFYRVRWFRYSPREDTWERADNFPENFIRRYRAGY